MARRKPAPSHSAGPEPEDIGDAFAAIADHPVPGTPPMRAVRTLLEVSTAPFTVDTRSVTELSIREGDPHHGAKRSDDHITVYEVSLPIGEVSDDEVPGSECEHCGCTTATYSYTAYHHIAGGESIECDICGDTLYSVGDA